jgi:hypothetical protein
VDWARILDRLTALEQDAHRQISLESRVRDLESEVDLLRMRLAMQSRERGADR